MKRVGESCLKVGSVVVVDREERRRTDDEFRARAEREAVRRERERHRCGKPAPAGLGSGVKYSDEDREVMRRIGAENPGESIRVLVGMYQVERGREIGLSTAYAILKESGYAFLKPGYHTDELQRARPRKRYAPRPDTENDAERAVREIAAILDRLGPSARARVRAWFADAEGDEA
jgi:hypothetical protein